MTRGKPARVLWVKQPSNPHHPPTSSYRFRPRLWPSSYRGRVVRLADARGTPKRPRRQGGARPARPRPLTRWRVATPPPQLAGCGGGGALNKTQPEAGRGGGGGRLLGPRGPRREGARRAPPRRRLAVGCQRRPPCSRAGVRPGERRGREVRGGSGGAWGWYASPPWIVSLPTRSGRAATPPVRWRRRAAACACAVAASGDPAHADGGGAAAAAEREAGGDSPPPGGTRPLAATRWGARLQPLAASFLRHRPPSSSSLSPPSFLSPAPSHLPFPPPPPPNLLSPPPPPLLCFLLACGFFFFFFNPPS